jgi:hypothetical protein
MDGRRVRRRGLPDPAPPRQRRDARRPGRAASSPPEDPGDEVAVERDVSGAGRIDTAVALSARAFDAADAAVLARADDFPDALAAATLAAEIDGPVLLTGSESLAPQVAEELDRLGTDEVYLVGGSDALSERIEVELLARGITSTRLSGPTASRPPPASRRRSWSSAGRRQAIVARADAFPDALAASALAIAARAPILLTDRRRAARRHGRRAGRRCSTPGPRSTSPVGPRRSALRSRPSSATPGSPRAGRRGRPGTPPRRRSSTPHASTARGWRPWRSHRGRTSPTPSPPAPRWHTSVARSCSSIQPRPGRAARHARLPDHPRGRHRRIIVAGGTAAVSPAAATAAAAAIR